MPINSPFFIKRYISNDLEQGALSRFFWYYPQDYQKVQFGGLGLFFEVTYSVSGDNYLEDHLVKLVWDFFVDAYYDDSVILTGLNRFKLAIKKSVQRLISLIEESNLPDGIDVNILYTAVVADPQNPEQAKVYLARIGETDVFLLRDGEHIGLMDIIPANDLTQPIQAGVGELQKGDVVLFGNKELIGASLDSQMIKSESWHTLLDSLQDFQTNLFGSKKIIVLGYFDFKDGDSQEGDVSLPTGGSEGAPEVVGAPNGGSLQNKLTIGFRQAQQKTKLWTGQAMGMLKGLPAKLPPQVSGGLAKIKQYVPQSRASQTGPAQPTVHNEPAPVHTAPPQVLDPTINPRRSDVPDNTQSSSEQRSSRRYTIDSIDVNSFRRRRSASGRAVSQFQQQVGSLWNTVVSKGKKMSDTSKPLYGVSKVVQTPYQGLRKRFTPIKLLIIGLGILLGVFVIWKVWSTIRTNQIKSENLAKIEAYTTKYDSVDSENDDQQATLCLQDGSSLLKSIQTQYGEVSQMKDVALKTSSSEISTTMNKCQIAYDTINDIVRVSEGETTADVITDFTVRIGDGSQVVDMAIQDGIVYVSDKGKAAVYAFNTTNNEIVRLDDPNQLIKMPSQIVVGEKKEEIYVWDSINGLLEYRSGKGFRQINVATKELVGGEMTALDYFGGNLYYALLDSNFVYRLPGTSEGFGVGEEYLDSESFRSMSDVLVDGSIYVALRTADAQPLVKYFGGKQDNFSFISETGYQLSTISAGYTSIYDNKPVYVFDQLNKTLVLIDKPSKNNHPGQGVMLKRVVYGGTRANAWSNIAEIAVSRDNNNAERGIYLLDGSLLWRIDTGTVLQ